VRINTTHSSLPLLLQNSLQLLNIRTPKVLHQLCMSAEQSSLLSHKNLMTTTPALRMPGCFHVFQNTYPAPRHSNNNSTEVIKVLPILLHPFLFPTIFQFLQFRNRLHLSCMVVPLRSRDENLIATRNMLWKYFIYGVMRFQFVVGKDCSVNIYKYKPTNCRLRFLRQIRGFGMWASRGKCFLYERNDNRGIV